MFFKIYLPNINIAIRKKCTIIKKKFTLVYNRTSEFAYLLKKV